MRSPIVRLLNQVIPVWYLGSYQNIPILSPAEFVEQYEIA